MQAREDSIAVEIACGITTPSQQESDWVARNGPESVYAAVAEIWHKVAEFRVLLNLDIAHETSYRLPNQAAARSSYLVRHLTKC